jgi:formylglycine-generating enzyme required for sulfatase activity
MNAAGEKRLIGGLATLLIGLIVYFSWPQPDWWLARELRSLAAVNLLVLPDGALEDCPNKVYGRIRGLLPVLVDEYPKKEVLVLRGTCRDGKVSLETAPASGGPVRHLAILPMFAADEARSARIYVGSYPQGVPVELDYKLVGVTPLMLNGIEPGSHFLRIRDRRYQAVEEQFVIERGQARQWKFVLKAGSGRLAVSSYPSGAEMLLDGVRQTEDVTPALIGPVPAGNHSLELRIGGKMRGKRQVQVPTGDTEFISIHLNDVETPPTVWRDAVSGVEFVWVPAGCYRMGCGDWSDSCEPDEYPVHDVCVDGFWLGRYELTQDQWQKIMGKNPANINRAPERPVNQVSWQDVQSYLKKLNARGTEGKYRLPTEAEWEYACRSAGREEKYAGGTDAAERAAGSTYIHTIGWVGQHFADGPFPPGKKMANGLGLYDMSGNLWEWTQDSYIHGAYRFSESKNPTWSQISPYRIVRGGSWFSYTRHARCAQRHAFAVNFKNFDLGMRLAKTP